MTTEKKWTVFCTKEVMQKEWVYADTEEEAKEVIRDNFIGLKPYYAEEIQATRYYMGIAY
jgi:hypothetical protein